MGHKWHSQVSLWATWVYYYIHLPLSIFISSSPLHPPSLCPPCGIRNVIHNMKETQEKKPQYVPVEVTGHFLCKDNLNPNHIILLLYLSVSVLYFWMINSANTLTLLTQFTNCKSESAPKYFVIMKQCRSIVQLTEGGGVYSPAPYTTE